MALSQKSFDDLFLTQEEHHTIRTLSTILEWTEPLVRRNNRARIHSPSDFEQGRRGLQYTVFDSFLQAIYSGGEGVALVRGRHVVDDLAVVAAVTASPEERPTGTAEQEHPPIRPSPEPDRVPAGTHPIDLSQDSERAEFSEGTQPIQYSVQFEQHDLPADMEDDPMSVYLRLLQEHDYNIPFALAAEISLKLLKDALPVIKQRERSYSYPCWTFLRFTLCICLEKFFASWRYGVQRNFLAVLMVSDEMESDDADLFRAKDIRKAYRLDMREHKACLARLCRDGIIRPDENITSHHFDAQGRRFMYKVLGRILKSIADASDRTQATKPQKTKATFVKADFKEALTNLAKATERLWGFLAIFGKETKPVLRWISNVCDLYETEKQHSPSRASPSLLDYEQGPEFKEDAVELNQDPEDPWHDACFRWLELICNHVQAVHTIHPQSPFQNPTGPIVKALKQLLPRAQCYTVRVKSSSQDNHEAGIEETLRETFSASYHHDHCDALLDWLRRHTAAQGGHIKETNWASPFFTGTIHSEVILLTLHTLTRKGILTDPAPSPEEISQYLGAHNIHVKAEVIRKLSKIGEVLALAKKCCPACNVVVNAVRSRRDLFYSGWHTKWVSTTLPPWTPRKVGHELIRMLQEEIEERARMAWELKRYEKQTCTGDIGLGSKDSCFYLDPTYALEYMELRARLAGLWPQLLQEETSISRGSSLT